MTEGLLRRVASVTQRQPIVVLLVVGVVSVLLGLNIRHLQLRTDLADLLGTSTPDAQLLRRFVHEMGYGNSLFIIIETAGDAEADGERMEAAGDRLVAAMVDSGLFSHARAGLEDSELLDVARYYVQHFPAFVDPAGRDLLSARLEPEGVREQVRRGLAGLVTPFSPLGSRYFVLDPLGLLEATRQVTHGPGGLVEFDLDWGGGGRFFSRDHRALLVVAEPVLPATDYEFAVRLMTWVHARVREVETEVRGDETSLRIIPTGAHAYAEQNRRLIQRNIQVASLVSILGNLLLCVLVYRWLPALALAAVPTALGILWTTGLISTYPGQVNLISLAFIAIIAGLGDDQVTYFFTRVPQELAQGRSIYDAVARTYVTTGKSMLFCVLTTSTGTLALALGSFRGLAELGLILTIGLVCLLVHTLVTVPALMQLWWRAFPTGGRGSPFRWLPSVARAVGRLVDRSPGAVLAAGTLLFAVALASIPAMQVSTRLDTLIGYDDPTFVGQRLLAERFGFEGTPTVLLVEGDEQSVLEHAERLQTALAPLVRAGEVRSVFAPSTLVPSRRTQALRARVLGGFDLAAAAAVLEEEVRARGLDERAFAPAVAALRGWASGVFSPLTVEAARGLLPPGMLDGSIERIEENRYLAAVTLYSADPGSAASLAPGTLESLRKATGSFVVFSYDQVAADLHARVVGDSRRALLATLFCVILITVVVFRSVRLSALVLLPIGYAIPVTVGVLALAGHQFTGMGFAAFPLIVGIGIDNGIHLVRRHLETPEADARSLLDQAGAALIQTNLTTIIGFAALLTATFSPISELGLTTAVGVGMTLLASLFLVPSVLAFRTRRRAV